MRQQTVKRGRTVRWRAAWPRRMHSGYVAWHRRVQCAIALSLLLLAAGVPPLFARSAPSAPPAAQATRSVLVMGDSLSAAYGLNTSQGWVALVAERIKDRHLRWKVVNASISGETTAGGASRIAGELKRHAPLIVVIELGANDGLRGLPLAQTRANLERMIKASKAAGARVLLIGMRIPPNYGREYTQGFERNFSDLAKQHGIAFLPFLLEPVALERASFQPDNLHPTAAVQPAIRDHVWGALAPMLK